MLPGEGAASARIRDRNLVIDRDHALALSVPEVNEVLYFGHGSHGHVTLEFDVPTVHKTLSDIFEGLRCAPSISARSSDLPVRQVKRSRRWSRPSGPGCVTHPFDPRSRWRCSVNPFCD